MDLFFSYHFNSEDEILFSKIYYLVAKQPTVNIFYWNLSSKAGELNKILKKEINTCSYFVFFWLGEPGKTQIKELKYAVELGKMLIPVKMLGMENRAFGDNEDLLNELGRFSPIVIEPKYKKETDNVKFRETIDKEAFKCADAILKWIELPGVSDNGLPIGYPFKYEKDIINEYLKGNGRLSASRIREGCPGEWPVIDRKEPTTKNPVPEDEIGAYRDWDGKEKKDPQIVPAALSDFHPLDGQGCLVRLGLTFPEAGPRYFHCYPRENAPLHIGIVVSGGIAPGINSVIAGIVKRHWLYDKWGKNHNIHIWAYLEGFKSLMKDRIKEGFPRRKKLYSSNDYNQRETNYLQTTLYDFADDGGSLIPTSRADDLMNPNYTDQFFKKVASSLKYDGISILYVIGGDGSMKAARALSHYASQIENYDLAVVGIPKTMDNDILWIWQSFGFLSAVEWAKGAIRQIYTEVKSNPRICIMQLFGSDSGFVVTHAALASGVCDLVLIPEHPFNDETVVKYILKKLGERYTEGEEGKSPYGIILLAETALPLDAKETLVIESANLSAEEIAAVQKYFSDGCRVKGQTQDELRSAGIKILSKALREALDQKGGYWKDFRVFTNEPRHLIRSIPPSSSDIIFGERLGSLAVDGSMAGFRDFMISQWLTEYVMVPLELVVLGRKRVPSEGIFWKSVRATTGQPNKLTDEIEKSEGEKEAKQ